MESCIAAHDSAQPCDTTLAERLERGEVHVLDGSPPLPLPSGDDRAFLRDQELYLGKEIVFEPGLGRLAGFRRRSAEQVERLREIMSACHREAQLWLRAALPMYGDAALALRTCFHVDEEATRCLRATARNDLLHVDALHHARGRRVLRLFVNLHPSDPRVWATSETLAKVLPREAPKSGLIDPAPRPFSFRLSREMRRLIDADREVLDPYDDFMLSFARHLRHSDEFQDGSPRRIWRFAPDQAWLAFTDSLVHADLRGRWVLDHVFLIPTSACVRPEVSPVELLASLNARSRRNAA